METQTMAPRLKYAAMETGSSLIEKFMWFDWQSMTSNKQHIPAHEMTIRQLQGNEERINLSKFWWYIGASPIGDSDLPLQ